jgi:DnaJ like chaperone protein
MTPSDAGLLIIVVLSGLFGGYWIVSKLFFRTPASSGQASRVVPAPPASAGTWYEVLQLAPSATADEVRVAYRHLILQYHPDKVATMGPEIRELAARKAQELNVAYAAGLRARGLSA